MPETRKIAAQVVIASPGGDAHMFTARNIQGLLPDAELARRVVNAFSALGFTPGPVVGNSFSIEAEPHVFRQVFGVSPQLGSDGRVRDQAAQSARAQAAPLSGLPVDMLPPTLRALVQAVVFSEPPAFGPGTMP